MTLRRFSECKPKMQDRDCSVEKPLNQPMPSLSYLLYLLLADEAERAGRTFVVVVKFACQFSRSCSFFTSVGCSTAGASSNPFINWIIQFISCELSARVWVQRCNTQYLLVRVNEKTIEGNSDKCRLNKYDLMPWPKLRVMATVCCYFSQEPETYIQKGL